MALDLGLDYKGPPRHARTLKMDLLKIKTSGRLAPQGHKYRDPNNRFPRRGGTHRQKN